MSNPIKFSKIFGNWFYYIFMETFKIVFWEPREVVSLFDINKILVGIFEIYFSKIFLKYIFWNFILRHLQYSLPDCYKNVRTQQSGNISRFSSVFRRIFSKICKKSHNVTVREWVLYVEFLKIFLPFLLHCNFWESNLLAFFGFFIFGNLKIFHFSIKQYNGWESVVKIRPWNTTKTKPTTSL